MRRNRMGITHLPAELTARIANYMGEKNLALLRRASKQTRQFAKNGSECRSEAMFGGRGITVIGTAVEKSGTRMGFQAHVSPMSVFEHGVLSIYMDISVYDDNWTSIAKGQLHTNKMTFTWEGNHSATVKNQITGCIARECARHAPLLAQIFSDASYSMIMIDGPQTAQQVRAATRRIRPA